MEWLTTVGVSAALPHNSTNHTIISFLIANEFLEQAREEWSKLAIKLRADIERK